MGHTLRQDMIRAKRGRQIAGMQLQNARAILRLVHTEKYDVCPNEHCRVTGSSRMQVRVDLSNLHATCQCSNNKKHRFFDGLTFSTQHLLDARQGDLWSFVMI